MADIRYFGTTRGTAVRRHPYQQPHAPESSIPGLLTELRMAVVYAGDKGTDGAVIRRTSNPRSWKSYIAVAEDIAGALRRMGVGDVCLLPDDMRLGERLRDQSIDLAWLNTAGVQGYHAASHAAAMLEMLGIPYVGHDPLTACSLDNKHVFKRIMRALGVNTPASVVWDSSRQVWSKDFERTIKETLGDGPYIVKPVTGRASLNVCLVDRSTELHAAVQSVNRQTENLVLVEAFVPGAEYCVAVCGPTIVKDGHIQRHPQPFVFSCVERVFNAGEQIFTSMDQRPINPERYRLLDPDRDISLMQRLSSLARLVYDELNLQSIIRLDVRADHAGTLHVLEANPKPDLKTPADAVTSLVCAGLPQTGLGYDDLILSLLTDRLCFLLEQRPASVPHLARLISARQRPRAASILQ